MVVSVTKFKVNGRMIDGARILLTLNPPQPPTPLKKGNIKADIVA